MIETNLYRNQRIANYKLLSLLGTGKSGEVWASLQEGSKDIVALKVYRQSAQSAQRSLYEYEMARQVRNEYILSPTNRFEENGLYCIVMPLCEGRSLNNLTGYMKEEDVWMVMHDVGTALHALHLQHIVHHDVKPSNILLRDGHYYLSDFGSCCEENKSARGDRIVSDDSSFKYDAPEVMRNQTVTASDIWSLGATVFHLFMGCHVFNGMGGHNQHERSPLPYMRKELPELSKLICRCLSFNPSDRPTAQTVVANALEMLEKTNSNDCHNTSRPLRPMKQSANQAINPNEFWPEEML